MKLLLFITAFLLQAHARGYGQTITLSVSGAKLEKVFSGIEAQSHYHFIYAKEELADARPVDLRVKNASLEEVLTLCLKGQSLSYSLQERYIIIQRKENKIPALPLPTTLSGKVTDEEGAAIPGATIQLKGSMIATASNAKGEWSLRYEGNYSSLVISSVGYAEQLVAINGRSYIAVQLVKAISSLDETVVIAYGNTTRRLNTGNVSKVSAEEISRQPVSNPVAALQGRVPGLLITQSSGVTGSAFKIELRGRTSLDQVLSKNDPLIIIDGVPFEPGNQPSNQFNSAVHNPRNISEGGISPLNTINPADIESIEVLKDADATAIYGSRGANGVLLITTKKGKQGKTKISAGFYSGWSKVTRTMDLLHTNDYVAMRKEAFANDGIVPTASNAADILLWDTTRYTDLKKVLTGGTAYSRDAQISVSGGSAGTQFFIGGGYHYETNVFSRQLSDQRGSMRFNVQHRSTDKKFNVSLSGQYATDKNKLIRTDLTSYLNLPPNVQLFDSAGNLSWQEKGVNLPGMNPFAEFERKYESTNDNLQANLLLSYELNSRLRLRLNSGFNHFSTEEMYINPKKSIAPSSATLASSGFANSSSKSWILEPQVEYSIHIKQLKVSALAGSSLQERVKSTSSILATNYTNDLLLQSVEAAGNTSVTNNYTQYRYAALFGRVNIAYGGKYLLNLSGRRDGSSRFGPASRFANFGAAGMGWVFSNEKFVKKHLPFLSFGKIRASYGVTGNDQIGDYKYLDLWTATNFTYQGVPGLRPTSLFNPDYNWERNRKAEAAVELGFFKDQLLLSAAYYQNRSNNQLIGYRLPSQSGFTSVTRNFGALVQNSGIEAAVSFRSILSTPFQWSGSFTISLPRNQLLAFPGLEQSSYSSSYVIGKSLSIIKRYRYTGVDPSTGVHQFEDVNGDGQLSGADFIPLENLDPVLFGGLQQQFSYKGLQLSFFFEYKKQQGRNYLFQQLRFYPGSANNQPLLVLGRWQKPGDFTRIQKFTSNAAGPAGGASSLLLSSSNAIYGDASYIRLKNVSISYDIPKKFLQKIHCEQLTLYVHAQNVLTITRYEGSDPETQNLYQLPPLRTVVAGINLNF